MVPARGCGKGEGGRGTPILMIEDFKTCTVENSGNASLKAQTFPELNIKMVAMVKILMFYPS